MWSTEVVARRILGSLLALVLATSLLLGASTATAQTASGISTLQTVDREPATVGQPHSFKVTVTNNTAPQHVGIKNFLPEGVDLVSATPSQGSCGSPAGSNDVVVCTLGQLPSGGSATVEVVAVPRVAGTLTNTVVSGGKLTPTSPDKATITVNPASE